MGRIYWVILIAVMGVRAQATDSPDGKKAQPYCLDGKIEQFSKIDLLFLNYTQCTKEELVGIKNVLNDEVIRITNQYQVDRETNRDEFQHYRSLGMLTSVRSSLLEIETQLSMQLAPIPKEQAPAPQPKQTAPPKVSLPPVPKSGTPPRTTLPKRTAEGEVLLPLPKESPDPQPKMVAPPANNIDAPKISLPPIPKDAPPSQLPKMNTTTPNAPGPKPLSKTPPPAPLPVRMPKE